MPPAIERLLGRALRSQRGRDRFLAINDRRFASQPPSVRLASAAFVDGAPMPARQAAAGIGGNLSPPLSWSGLPEGTAELALVVQDPDAPLPHGIVHCIATGLRPGPENLPEGALRVGHTPPGVKLGRGSFKKVGYQGARPILAHGMHRYVFQVFALSSPLDLQQPDLKTLVASMEGRLLATGRLIGTYERN